MKNWTRASAVVCALAVASAAFGLAVAGCGGDDTIVTPDSGSDGSRDATLDQGTDAPRADAPFDSGHDAADGRVNDARTDAPPDFDSAGLYTFPHTLDVTYCTRLAACCGEDGGQFDIAACAKSLDDVGAAFGNVGIAQLDSGNLTFVQSEALKCLNDTATLPCGIVNSTTVETLTTECAGALEGKLGPDAGPCATSFDCLPSNYCKVAGGRCVPLQTVGESCTAAALGTDCSYLGNGGSHLYCGHDKKCVDQLAVGTACGNNDQCETLICDFSVSKPTCSNSSKFTGRDGGLCGDYPVDGG